MNATILKITALGLLLSVMLTAEQVEVTSEEMQAFDTKKEVHFIGDANATQGKNWIHGDRIVVYLTQENKAKEYVVQGRVTFELDQPSGYYKGRAKKVTYNPDTSVYVLTGDAVVDDLRNKRHLHGEKITINTLTGKANVKSAKTKGKRTRPVKFTFESGGSKKKAK
jgi:lipopolysaccharide export system protein LptA